MSSSTLPNLLLRSQSDDRLVELTRGGSERAFTTIVERYRAELVRYSSRFVGRDLAEDVVQQALMNARRGLRRDTRAIALRPWLYRICHNLALNECRRTKVHEELDENLDGVPQPPDIAQTRQDLQQLVHHMVALPARQRQALTAYELEGRGYAEIAAAMDTGPSSVRGLIARARAHLRDACGALVPLPLLRHLVDASAAGSPAAAAASAGGVGLAVKAAAVVTAASVMATGAVVLKTQSGRADSVRASAPGYAAASLAQAEPASATAFTQQLQGSPTGPASHAKGRRAAGRYTGGHRAASPGAPGAALGNGSGAASPSGGSGADGSSSPNEAPGSQATAADAPPASETPPADQSAPAPGSEAPVDPTPDPPPDPAPDAEPPPA